MTCSKANRKVWNLVRSFKAQLKQNKENLAKIYRIKYMLHHNIFLTPQLQLSLFCVIAANNSHAVPFLEHCLSCAITFVWTFPFLRHNIILTLQLQVLSFFEKPANLFWSINKAIVSNDHQDILILKGTSGSVMCQHCLSNTQNQTSSGRLQSILFVRRFRTWKKRDETKYVYLIPSSNNTWHLIWFYSTPC